MEETIHQNSPPIATEAAVIPNAKIYPITDNANDRRNLERTKARSAFLAMTITGSRRAMARKAVVKIALTVLGEASIPLRVYRIADPYDSERNATSIGKSVKALNVSTLFVSDSVVILNPNLRIMILPGNR
jgi:hypothetical protein